MSAPVSSLRAQTEQPTRRPRVCLATLRFYPVYAGPALRFQRYGPGLKMRGVDLDVFTCGEERLPSVDVVDGIGVTRCGVQYSPSARLWRRYGRSLVRYCSQNGARPDVVQLLSLSEWAVPSLIRLRRRGVRLVYTHTMVREPSGPAWARLVKDFAWSVPLSLLDCVVVSSRVMRDEVVRRGVRTRVEVIPNGVDVQRFRPLVSDEEKHAVRRRLGLEPDSDIILFVGYLNRRKGLDVLAEAWARLSAGRPSARLVLVSPGYEQARARDPEFIDELQAVLRGAGTADRVTFAGPAENVEEYMRAADVFAFPSRREGMPNVVPEAFASGVPVVLAPFAGLPREFGSPGRHYILAERTSEHFASAIGQLLDQPARGAELGREARSWVERTMSLQVSLDRYAALYAELASQ